MDAPNFRGYSYLTGFAITINYVIGTGAFALPFAMVQSGIVLALTCLVLFTLVSCVCLSYVMESMARTGGIIAADASDSVTKSDVKHSEATPLLAIPSSHSLSSSTYHPQVGFNKIDYVLMCRMYGGETASGFVHACMALYSLGVLWAYAAVFSSSVDTLFFQYALGQDCNIYQSPSFECSAGYCVSVLIFAVIVVWLSLKEVHEQAFVQSILTFYRVTALLTMIATLLVAFYYPNQFDSDARNEPPTIASIPMIRYQGFALIFSVTAVALDLHWNSPDIVTPLAEKAHALVMMLAALVISAGFYGLIAIVCALEFGQATLPLVTLNWQHYTGKLGGFAPVCDSETIPFWAVSVKLFIICFPVLNQISVYPLVVVTLGDNYVSLIPSSIQQSWQPASVKRLCRLLASIPPIFFALCFGKLDAIFAFTGLFAFALVFVIPCLLQLRSSAEVRKRFGADYHTQYSSVVSHPAIVRIVLVFGVSAFVISCINLVSGY